MNILHVVNIYFVLPYFIGGQFKHFREKGHRLNVVCSPSEYLDDYARENQFEYIATPVNRAISLREDAASIREICRFIRRQKIDIVVGHTPKGALLAMVAGWLCRVPRRIYLRHGLVYETSHGLKRQILMNVDRLASALATKIVCVSPSVMRRSVEDHLAPASKQIILANGTCNGIDTQEQFNPARLDAGRVAALREKYGLREDNFVIGYSGRLVRDKGIIELVRAFDSLKDAENCRLLLVGMFEERDALPEDVKRRILEDPRIIFTGFVNGGMEYYYALMNLYVLPSYREGFPTGVLEAQSMELPVVTTRVTGCCDSILEGHTGLFAENNTADIARAIDEIRLKGAIDGANGRKWVVEKFDSRIVWADIERLYN